MDPIDGTHNLVRGIPVFGTLLAVEEEGELVVAAISAPAMARRWWAIRGEGAVARDHLGERPIHVSTIDRLEEAQLVTSGIGPLEQAGFGPAVTAAVHARSGAIVASASSGATCWSPRARPR